MAGTSGVQRLGTDSVGKLLLEMPSQTTFSLLVYAIDSITDTYFLSVGVGALVCAICLLIPATLITVLSHDTAAIAEGQTALWLLALAYPLAGVAMVVAAFQYPIPLCRIVRVEARYNVMHSWLFLAEV